MKVTHKIRLRFALAHSKFYPFPPLPPPTNVGSLVCIMATTRFHIFLYAISARQPTLQGGGRGGDRMRLGIYQKFPLYPVKRQFPILSQNNYSMIVGIIRIKTGSGVMKAIRQIIYIKKNSGPRIEPCGTPVLIVFEDEIQPLISQTCSLLAKYDVNQSSSTFLRPNCVFILHSKIL